MPIFASQEHESGGAVASIRDSVLLWIPHAGPPTVERVSEDGAVTVTRNIYWVGFLENERLRCNPYLLVDRDCAVLFDPGSIPDFPSMMRKVIDLVDPAQIELVVVHHQDPDVAGCLPVLEDVIGRADLRIAAHTNTHRLIQHLGFQAEPWYADREGYRYALSSGDELEFIWTPYAHSPGGLATYHQATGSLFTSDIFGAVGVEGGLFDMKDYPEAMKGFHQAYMPSNRVLRVSLEKLDKLPIQRLLPQHGNIIERSHIAEAFEYLKQLPCGIDLLPEGE